MKISNMAVITLTLLLFTAVAATAQSRPVTGVASASIFGGNVPEHIVKKARAEAAANFNDELRMWLRENIRIDLDTANTIKNFALQKLAERCLESAEEKTVSRGRVWTLSLSVSESSVRDALRAHNDHFNAQASMQYLSAASDDPNEALHAAISALASAMAKIEPAGAGGNTNEIRTTAQGLFDRVRVKAPNTVIEGRQGSLPQKAPVATFTIDSVPLAKFNMTAFVQNGREFARVATDSRGELPMKNYEVPFVHNGSMLTVSPDARNYIKSDRFIRFRDIGLRFSRGQELSFIFKVPTLTYKLEYKVFSRAEGINIPPDFSSDAHVRKYLKEVCGLMPAHGSAAADLNIRIGAEITMHTYNDTEEEGLKMSMRGEFRGAGIDKAGQEVFEKRQRFGLSFQTGAYFWEASGAIRDFISNTLAKD
ncbi:MAG: hypothetical protein FWC23_00240 [Chitinispirillia bacterium]|nr:hypothetical protein [Chitinispirillia bacterium]MCL2267604.1 hypothetical protein [Chitinispirillia bacterium]